MLRLMTLVLSLTFAMPVQATCTGQDIIASLPDDQRMALRAAADAAPYAHGNLWQATRGDQSITMVGTFHLPDPRFDEVLTRLLPLLDASTALLVEAGPEEEEALRQKMAGDPGTMMDMAGPSLEDQMPPEQWQKLSAALLQRGVPSALAGKLRPWFVSMMLAIPACALPLAALESGLDKKLIAAAQEKGLPVIALESYDTALRMFDSFSIDDQIEMIESALLVEERSEDYLATTASAYFDQRAREVWELNRLISSERPGVDAAQNDAEMAQMEAVVMTGRNREWIAVLEKAAENGPVFAAFGALHLSGKEGVLNLLAEQGWNIERKPF